MVDLETTSIYPDAQITQVGAVVASNLSDPSTWEGYRLIRYPLQKDRFTFDTETLKFWMDLPKETRDLALFGIGKPHEVLYPKKFVQNLYQSSDTFHWAAHQFFLSYKGAEIWAWPATLDLHLLENTFHKLKVDTPWDFNMTRCAKSVCKTLGVEREEPLEGKHDALIDAFVQMRALAKALSVGEKHA